jgi:N-acetylmuramoyl-L-alanine amidase
LVFGDFFGAASWGAGSDVPPNVWKSRLHRLLVVVLVVLAGAGLAPSVAAAQDGGGARLVGGATEAGFWSRSLTLRLAIDGAAPFRVFTLAGPPRLVVDLEGAAAPGFDAAALVDGPVVAARAGAIRPGWARLVLELDRPFALETAELAEGALVVRLGRVSAAELAARAGAPPGVWPPAGAAPLASATRGAGPVTVAIDAGHGGIDPGAVREGLREKDLALAFATDLAAALAADGRFRAVLTRTQDTFLPLAERVALARAAGADAFLSIHTNAVADPAYSGAIVFTRSERGSDGQAADRARLENQADRVAALEVPGGTDAVRAALGDLARVETDARSALLADALVEGVRAAGAGVAPFPRRSADFVVLGAADIPSALVEIGFLSNAADRAAMNDPAWRARAARGVAAGLGLWLARDADLASRLRR